MLPAQIRLSKQASEQLKQLKERTGISRNVLARLALSRSISDEFNYKTLAINLDGMDLHTPKLLGDYAEFYEKLLMELHNIETSHELTFALATHIENGLNHLKNVRDLSELLSQINTPPPHSPPLVVG
jgi:DNA sulfur modification protein DndE